MEYQSKIITMNERIGNISDCVRFDKGSGNFAPIPAFAEAVDAIIDDLKSKYHGYMPQQGLWELREQICELEYQTSGSKVNIDQILITHGVKNGVFLALGILCSPNDEVLTHDVHFEGFMNTISFHNLRPKTCNFLDITSVEKAVSKKTKVMILNSPENPTGKVYSRKEIESLAEVVRENNIFVISDDVNNQLIYEGTVWENIRSIIPERTITVNSFSKNYFLPGLRVGWLIASPQLIKKLVGSLESQTVCVNRFGQLLAREILTRLSGKRTPSSYIQILAERREAMKNILQEEGFTIEIPQGGTNFFLDTGVPSEQFAEYLLGKHKVAVVPGVYFGAHGENHIRLGFGSVTMEEIGRGCRAIGRTRRELLS